MLFHERQKTLRDEWPKVFRIDIFPQEVREQCWQALSERYERDPYSLKNEKKYELTESLAQKIVHILRRKIGAQKLSTGATYEKELKYFFQNGCSKNKELENIELAFSSLELLIQHTGSQEKAEEINDYLRRGGIGYKFSYKTTRAKDFASGKPVLYHDVRHGYLIPYTDENLLESAVIPVISLLNQHRFGNTYQYLHQAFEHYRNGKFESCVDDTAKSCESLLKIILEERKIKLPKKRTLFTLLLEAKNNGLFLDIANDKLTALANLLMALVEIRNKKGGHGGEEKADGKVARLALHHATANMLYIAESHIEKP